MRGTFDLGVLNEKRTHPNTEIEWPKWDFRPFSIITCHNFVGAVAYVRRKRSLKVELLSKPKMTSANTSDKRRFSNLIEIYP
jgi:hypothetical protein